MDHNFDYKLDQKPIHSLKELVKISKFKNNEIDVPFPTLVGYLGYPMIQYIVIFFMFIAGTNFVLSYYGFKFNFRKILKDEEFKTCLLYTSTLPTTNSV